MQKFSANAFYDIAATLQEMSHAESTGVIGSNSKLLEEFLPTLEMRCAEIGLRLSEKAVQRLREEFAGGAGPARDFQAMIPELHRRISDEMEDKKISYSCSFPHPVRR